MKKSLFIILTSLFISCKEDEETGVCSAYDSNQEKADCISSITKSQCETYNEERLDGYSWQFVEADLCPPPGQPEIR